MKKIAILMAVIIAVLVAGCAKIKDFSYGAKQLEEINAKYNTTLNSYPSSIQEIDLLIEDLKQLKSIKLDKEQEQFDYLFNYRLLNLEAEKLYLQGMINGNYGSTEGGFGCKQRPIITESAVLRNSSAMKGFEAVEQLKIFLEKYPDYAQSVNLSHKGALFLNASFYMIKQAAKKDSGTINSFCPIGRVLQLYKEEFAKKTNLSKDFINSLDYEEAVKIWKGLRGFR